jgi:hypothetical protein
VAVRGQVSPDVSQLKIRMMHRWEMTGGFGWCATLAIDSNG